MDRTESGGDTTTNNNASIDIAPNKRPKSTRLPGSLPVFLPLLPVLGIPISKKKKNSQNSNNNKKNCVFSGKYWRNSRTNKSF